VGQLDFAIVNVARPAIGRKLRFPESDLQWAVAKCKPWLHLCL